MAHTKRGAVILAALVVSAAALTACTRAEAEPPITQTSADTSATTTVTPTPEDTKPTVTLTEMPEDPEIQAALMAYAKFEHAMQNMAITGASDESVDSALGLVEADSDAEKVVHQMTEQYADMGPRQISGTLEVTYYDVIDQWDNTVQLSLCLDGTKMTPVSGPPLPHYLKSTPAMTKTESGWVITYYRAYQAHQCE